MKQFFREKTEQHLLLLDKAVKLSEAILEKVLDGNFDDTLYFCDNRERLINIISKSQVDIENSIDALENSEIDRPLVLMLEHWQKKVNEHINYMLQIDRNLVDRLENEKDETVQEIAKIFRSKQNLRGYNLNDVSK